MARGPPVRNRAMLWRVITGGFSAVRLTRRNRTRVCTFVRKRMVTGLGWHKHLIAPQPRGGNSQLLRRFGKRSPRLQRSVHPRAIASSASIVQLKEKIRVAIDEEDYEAAATYRDELRIRQENAYSAVEEANRMFYVAFQTADLKLMRRIWGKGSHVQCLHPMTPCLAGHDDVIAGWNMILKGISAVQNLTITLKDVRIHASDTQAFVTCVECMEGVNTTGWTAATNIFEKGSNGEWALIHHQGGPLPKSGAGPDS